MIRVENLTYAYEPGRTPALRNVAFEIRDGARIALVGPNGSGKTTLLRHLNGLLLPNEGNVLVDGRNTRDRAALPWIRQKVGMVFQNPDNQIVGMTVEEDVAFGPGNLRLPAEEIRRRVDRALDTVGLRGFAERVPHALSSGEKQLVAMAGILAMEPSTVVLDEPTAYLDPAGRSRVREVIQRLHASGVTIIHVTHDMNEVVNADEVFVLDHGQLAFQDTPSRVFRRNEELRRIGLEPPAVTALMERLRAGGLDVRPDVLTMDEACAALMALLGKDCEGEGQGMEGAKG
ncbi:MAG: energy-coupling factor transporter ATPase [Desulfobacteraceae bacterium]|jgi:biotin transport system ATP-binding protein/energy-coupling factor transport system ATP-binding protein